MSSSRSMSQSTGWAPTASRSGAWSGLRIRPRARSPRSASSRNVRRAIWPCPPAMTTSMARRLRPLEPAALLRHADRLEAAVHVELLHDRREVVARRAVREVEGSGQLGGRAVPARLAEHLALALGERAVALAQRG